MEPMIRRSFPEFTKPMHYDPVDWKPTFQELFDRQSETMTIVLKNRLTGGLEKMSFDIIGYSRSPITTINWIWGKIQTDGQDTFTLTFNYYDGVLQSIIVACSPKSLPHELLNKRLEKVSYPAAVTAFDLSNYVDEDK